MKNRRKGIRKERVSLKINNLRENRASKIFPRDKG
jgi:hypothetical protein